MRVRRWVVGRLGALRRTGRLRRAARRGAGVLLLGTGLILMILPGPGIPFVVAGMVLLDWDATWVRRLGRRVAGALLAMAGKGGSLGFAPGRVTQTSSTAG